MADDIPMELTLQMGRPVSQVPGEVRGFIDRAEYMLSIATSSLADVSLADTDKPGFRRYIKRVPLGVVLVIAPWKYVLQRLLLLHMCADYPAPATLTSSPSTLFCQPLLLVTLSYSSLRPRLLSPPNASSAPYTQLAFTLRLRRFCTSHPSWLNTQCNISLLILSASPAVSLVVRVLNAPQSRLRLWDSRVWRSRYDLAYLGTSRAESSSLARRERPCVCARRRRSRLHGSRARRWYVSCWRFPNGSSAYPGCQDPSSTLVRAAVLSRCVPAYICVALTHYLHSMQTS